MKVLLNCICLHLYCHYQTLNLIFLSLIAVGCRADGDCRLNEVCGANRCTCRPGFNPTPSGCEGKFLRLFTSFLFQENLYKYPKVFNFLVYNKLNYIRFSLLQITTNAYQTLVIQLPCASIRLVATTVNAGKGILEMDILDVS